MEILISQDLIGNITNLNANTAKKVWQFIGRFQKNPKNPGLRLERVKRSPSDHVWSARLDNQYRVILHKDNGKVAILHVNKHDDAYHWARNHRVSENQFTGGLQLLPTEPPALPDARELGSGNGDRKLYADYDDEYFLQLGVPTDFLMTIRQIRDEDMLLRSEESFPPDLFVKLMQLADGQVPAPVAKKPNTPATRQPATLDSFHVISEETNLAPLLEQPFQAWVLFMHPSQEKVAYQHFNGPVKISGSAGTGKTVAALHRTAWLAREGCEVLLCTYTPILVKTLSSSLDLLLAGDPDSRERIEVKTVHAVARTLLKESGKNINGVGKERLSAIILECLPQGVPKSALSWYLREWKCVIEFHGIENREAYLEVSRAGRGDFLSPNQRQERWKVFERVFQQLRKENALTWSFLCKEASLAIEKDRVEPPYDAVIVDECQDLGCLDLKFLANLAPNNVTFFGDAGQRVYSPRVNFRQLGIEVRGRSFTLRTNYRTTRQIRQFADRISGKLHEDLNGLVVSRLGVTSLMSGPEPELREFESRQDEKAFVIRQILALLESGLEPESIAVIGRLNQMLRPFADALREEGQKIAWVKDGQEAKGIRLLTMHSAKGLEFRAVIVVGASRDHLPQGNVLDGLEENSPEWKELMEQEKNLLYVALTRARDLAVVTWVGQPSSLLP